MEVVFDDFTGEPADRTVTVGFDGRWFELDLTEANAEYIESVLSGWAGRGRDATSGKPSTTRTAASRSRSANIRSWAREQGWDLATRGRLPAEVVVAYENRQQ
ncbi:histone-like nucleoid-structuring protein Lsr2 [Rhodococcoides kroppenstedtii]|jgi:hypothetical protein|uniref:histone-like nucleoid-structuring protein Lsr2 n=1 Tax=Rhodococcoides kroppenstedtii TaxID=293050 RepID=UPI0035303A70